MTLHRFARIVAGCVLLLVVAGGLVTSTGSGLSVPDWPLSYGQLFPPMVGGVRFEHTHRVIAGTVALLTVVLAVWLWRAARTRPLRWAGIVAVGFVIAQALLGGLTVLLRLPPSVSVAHACLGQLFFCSVVTVTVLTSPSWRDTAPVVTEDAARLRRLAAMTTAFLFIQLLLGAIVRHTHRWVLPHLVTAVLVMLHVALLARRVTLHHRAQPRLTRPATALVALVALQWVLGVAALIIVSGGSATPPPALLAIAVRTGHVAVGALLLAMAWILTLAAHHIIGTGSIFSLTGEARKIAPVPFLRQVEE